MSPILVPVYSMPTDNRRVLLAVRPDGIPQASHFAIDRVPVEEVADGCLLIRNIYLSVDPAQRGWATAGANYADPVLLGGPMRALTLGVVVRSRHPDYPEGCYVYGWGGWQDYAVLGPDQVMMRIGSPAVPLSAYAGVLGINGLTAWLALFKLGRPVAGETVLVSTAAGAVGSVVGQLARGAGCRVIGLTGDDAKVRSCTERFGYAAAANYRDGPIEPTLAALAGEGVDIFFDNVGGPILDAALRVMRPGGRVVQCGTASVASWTPPPPGPRNEREVLTRRLIWSGFVVFDHRSDYARAAAALAAMVVDGTLAYDEDIAEGIETAPGALDRLYRGENRGKQLIFIG